MARCWHDVVDDGFYFVIVERSSLNFRANGIQTVRSHCGRNGHEASGLLGEATECGFGKSDLINADQAVVGYQQGRQQDLFAATEFDAAEAAKDFRAQRPGPARNHHHVFTAGIEVHSPDLQLRT